jgi:hypothetical protein
MPKKPKLPDRFAILMIEELADIHAVVQTMAEFQIADLAEKLKQTGMDNDAALQAALATFEAKRDKRGKRYMTNLFERLDLEHPEPGSG